MGYGGFEAGNWFLGWGGMFSGALMMLFWFGLFVLLIVWLARWAGGDFARNRDRGALVILEQRFADGEIGAEEFLERSKQLRAEQ